MNTAKKITEEQLQKAIELKRNGYTYLQIASELKYSSAFWNIYINAYFGYKKYYKKIHPNHIKVINKVRLKDPIFNNENNINVKYKTTKEYSFLWGMITIKNK